MIRILIFVMIVLMIFTTGLSAQWASSLAGSMAAEEAESPTGLLFGVGTANFEDFSMRGGFYYRLTDNITVAGKADGTYDDEPDKVDANLGFGVFYFIGQARTFYIRFDYIPKFEREASPQWQEFAAGFGYMGRSGKIPLIGANIGTAYIIDIGPKLNALNGKKDWWYHFLVSHQF